MTRKSKRKIVVNEREYYWYVAEDLEDVGWLGAPSTLTVLSKDKKFIIKYPFPQSIGKNHMVVIGSEFGGEGKFGGTYQRVVTPVWESEGAITPGIVRSVIEWSISIKPLVYVNYLGKLIEENV